MPYTEFVKTCPEWEEPEDQGPVTEEMKVVFKDWLEKF
jgi:hypothetical protein